MTGSPPRKPAAPRKQTPAVLRKLTPAPGRRLDERVPVDVPMALRIGKRRLALMTGDVSHGGLFVVTDERFDLRQLVHVEIVLPTDGKGFTATGWLVHARALDGNARGAGVGVQFYGLGREEQDRWDAFVTREKGRAGGGPEARDPTPARGVTVPRAFSRDASHVGVVRVTFASLADLRTKLARDIVRGALFFATDPLSMEVGDRLGLEIVHPTSHDVFEMEGRVRRVVRDTRVEGLEVKIAMDEERRRRFTEFVDDPVAPDSEPVR